MGFGPSADNGGMGLAMEGTAAIEGGQGPAMQTNARFARGPAGNFHILVTHSMPACAQGLDHGFFGGPTTRQPIHHIGREVVVQQSFGIEGFPGDRSSQ